MPSSRSRSALAGCAAALRRGAGGRAPGGSQRASSSAKPSSRSRSAIAWMRRTRSARKSSSVASSVRVGVVEPVAEDVQVLVLAVDGRELDRRRRVSMSFRAPLRAPRARRQPCRGRSARAAHARLRGPRDHLGGRAARRRNTSSATGDRTRGGLVCGHAGNPSINPITKGGTPMTTGAIIAIVVVALIIIALLAFVLPRMRARARVQKRERELQQRRERVAGEHRAEADARERQAAEAEQRARIAAARGRGRARAGRAPPGARGPARAAAWPTTS